MSKSKHAIRISRPSKSCQLYFWQCLGCFPTFVAKSGSDTVAMLTSEYHFEYLRNGAVADQYRNRPVLHTFKEANINLLTLGVAGYDQRTDINNPKLYQGIWVGSKYIMQYGYFQGASSYEPDSGYAKCISTTSISCVLEYWRRDGHLESTQTLTLISAPPSNIDGWSSVKIREKLVYSEYMHKYFSVTDYTKEYYQYGQVLTYIGEIDLNRLPTDGAILDLIRNYKMPNLAPDIVKDSFYEDLLSKYALPDVNNIENLKDFKDIKKSIPPIVKLIKRRSFKSFAELYLWYKYTYSTTKLDLKSYYKFLVTWLEESMSKNSTKHTSITYSASSTSGNDECSQITRYNIYSDNYNCGVMKTLGLDLSMSNTWDLIPFSFVVDWFINFGDILKTLDNREVISEINVHSVVTSNKYTTTYYPLKSIGINDPVIASYYNRSVSRSLPVPMSTVSLINPVRHTTDGLALLIARK